ncbi:unnamed protein product [Leuciscus chuanchicus]
MGRAPLVPDLHLGRLDTGVAEHLREEEALRLQRSSSHSPPPSPPPCVHFIRRSSEVWRRVGEERKSVWNECECLGEQKGVVMLFVQQNSLK